MKRHYIILGLSALALVACNKDSELSTFASDPNAVRIQATVGETQNSPRRAPGSNPFVEVGSAKATQFNEGAQLSVATEDQAAVTYTLTNGVWTPEVDKYLKWNETSQEFTAYYPATYTGAALVPAVQNTQDAIAAADYMKFEGYMDKPYRAPYTVNFEMQRQTARVVINSGFRYNNELETMEGYTISVTVSDGTTTVTPYLYNGRYYALLNPTAYAMVNETFVTITLKKANEADKEFIVRGVPVLEKGYSYEYNITIGKDRATISSVEVSPWTNGGVIDGNEHLTEEVL